MIERISRKHQYASLLGWCWLHSIRHTTMRTRIKKYTHTQNPKHTGLQQKYNSNITTGLRLETKNLHITNNNNGITESRNQLNVQQATKTRRGHRNIHIYIYIYFYL